ncbi:hypothetical protein SISSUDRAFT_93590 [Sistotremastrum suecicum HHB10207 ss-3]|uniref:Uncharacterized protein n=1 Tax=Sistotremastrum suecicum HHB10207 ss-3 TaxID=1314776 RepID=A0A166B7X1_9AGAM|nr:hypothetical protein SISSUDRAFT_93590 [Sistotremastrum suecicum HHB10207 ss-3]
MEKRNQDATTSVFDSVVEETKMAELSVIADHPFLSSSIKAKLAFTTSSAEPPLINSIHFLVLVTSAALSPLAILIISFHRVTPHGAPLVKREAQAASSDALGVADLPQQHRRSVRMVLSSLSSIPSHKALPLHPLTQSCIAFDKRTQSHGDLRKRPRLIQSASVGQWKKKLTVLVL